MPKRVSEVAGRLTTTAMPANTSKLHAEARSAVTEKALAATKSTVSSKTTTAAATKALRSRENIGCSLTATTVAAKAMTSEARNWFTNGCSLELTDRQTPLSHWRLREMSFLRYFIVWSICLNLVRLFVREMSRSQLLR